MRILRVKKGFTTNSSGSYEWLDIVLSTSTHLTAASSSATSTFLGFIPQKMVRTGLNWAMPAIAAITGFSAVYLFIKDFVIKKKK